MSVNKSSRKTAMMESKDSKDTTKQILIAATFTAEPILTGLDFWNKKLELNFKSKILNYNQVFQELLNPASLLGSNEDGLNVIMLRFEDWLPYKTENPFRPSALPSESEDFKQLRKELFAVLNDFISALQSFQTKASCRTLLMICPNSYDYQQQEHWKLCFNEIETLLSQHIQKMSSVNVLIAEKFHEQYQVDAIDDPFRNEMGHIPFVDGYYNFLSTLLVRYYYGLICKGYKVIVLDCDNTLWKGVCGETRPEEIEIESGYKEFQQLLVRQKEQGMLLCLCSKNVIEDVWNVFDNRSDFPIKKEHLADYRINWQPKSENLYSLSESLNLGLDSFIFIDDNPVECAEVRANCPQVLTLQWPEDEGSRRNLIQHTWIFDHFSVTSEDAKRTEMIQQNLQRQALQKECTSFTDFLQKLELSVDIKPVESDNLPRVSQLTERTNQFNFTTIRRSESKIRSLMEKEGYECRIVNVQDRFGEYGLAGAMIYLQEEKSLRLDSFILSCRVLGRGVEHKMMAWLGEAALERGFQYVETLFAETEKNKPAHDFLDRIAGQLAAEIKVNSVEKQIKYVFDAKSLSEFAFVPPSDERPAAAPKEMNASEKTAYSSIVWQNSIEAAAALTNVSRISQAVEYAAHGNRMRDFEIDASLSAQENIREYMIWFICKELGYRRNQVKLNKNIQDYGVDSIVIMKLMSGFEKHFHGRITRREMIEYPTIKGLSAYLAKKVEAVNEQESRQPVIAHWEAGYKTAKGPLSEMQKGFWVLHKMYPSMNSYNVPICFRIFEKLNVETFKQACEFLLKQYPILTSVIRDEDGVPYQELRPYQSLDFTHEDITNLEADGVIPYVREKNKRVFSLEEGPLIYINLLTRSENEYIVLITIHHIILDGSSQVLITETLLNAYKELAMGKRPIFINTSASYNDFVRWEQKLLEGEDGEEHSSYWRQQLSGPLPLLELPADHSRKLTQSFRGKIYNHSISKELSRKVKAYAAAQHLNLPVVFLGVFKALIYRYTGQEDIIVGMPVKRRPSEIFEPLVGLFVNMIPVRSQVLGYQSFLKYMQELQLILADALDHSLYPFPAIVRDLNVPRNQGSSPVYQTVFAYQNFINPNDAKNLHRQVEFIEEISQAGEYEFGLEVFDKEDGFVFNMKYSTELFEPSTIVRMMGHYIRLLEGAIDNTVLALGKHSLLSDEEEKTILCDWNSTQADYPKDKCMHSLFEQQAQKTPDALAVSYEGKSLTYRELNDRSTILASCLQQRGIGPDSLVGICTERSLELMIGIFGILKAGGAYVPLDPGYPMERLEYMVQDSSISLILTQLALREKAEQLIDGNTKIVYLDKDWPALEREAESHKNLNRDVRPDNLVYVIYTSGSTGKPKGVMVRHQSLVNLIASMGNRPGLKEQDIMLSLAPYGFDMVIPELYLPLINGAQCCICSAEKAKDAERLKKEIKTLRPTIMQATPTTCKMLFHSGWRNAEKVKILCGAEALPDSLKQLFIDNNCDVWNMYGPTEATVWCTYQHITAEEPVTIGKPIANTQIYILDDHMNPTPVRISGEICIAGDGLARGYLNKPELTEEKFIDNPFRPGTKLYRTGDLGRWLLDGSIEYVGRNDLQVKVRGFRIELGEIEAQLRTHHKVQDCVAIIKEQEGNKQLIAYYTAQNNDMIDPQQLRDHLKVNLPDYMIPAFFVPLDEIPLTPNGKINRKELMSRKVEIIRTNKACAPQSEIEERLLNIWKELLHIDNVSTEDGFFDVGGDSFLAVVLAEKIKNNLECDFNVTLLFKYPNIKAISKFITEAKGVNQSEELEIPLEVMADNSDISISTDYPDYYKDSMAIIGISCQVPGAKNHYEFWNNLRHGKESIRFFSKEELRELGLSDNILQNPDFIPAQSTIDGKDLFDPGFFNISHRDAELMDPQMRLLLLHSWKAVEDAGYISKHIPETSVFMSASNSYYQAFIDSFAAGTANIMSNPDEYVSWVLAQGGTIPTIISHKLGLKGPSIFVHSNCSSSLVGLYSAYQSLQSGDAKYALVGASTVFFSTGPGYIHNPGLNFSSDGRIKAFDASADGMIGGEGVAVILLKKAVDAVADGDHIYAILRGVSANNDGADKVGFYAPSVKGQEEVIRKTLEAAKINPESISYVEAHGTGTKLGDPIEFAALSEAYRKYTDKKQFCGLGSVKTNIGHLDTAAGLAGCIKVALSLYYGEIPPSLNYKKTNPSIDLDNSPFYIAKELKKLEERSIPHRAGLTSLGIGGTNAHAIFEQYPRVKSLRNSAILQDNKASYAVPLSAKNRESLEWYAKELIDFLKASKENQISLADLAYTLQIGREAMESRIIFIVRDAEQLIQRLDEFISGNEKIEDCFIGDIKQSKDFIQLYEKDEDDKELLNRWLATGKVKKLAELWAKGLQLNWESLYPDRKPSRISLPTYPFAKERFWITKTDADRAMGASAVKASIHPLLHQNTSDLYEQRYSSTFTGQEFFLSDHIVKGQRILPGVAYLEMARAAVTAAIGSDEAKKLKEGRSIIRIKDAVWIQPIAVGDKPVQINIGLLPDDNREIAYEIYSDPQEAAEETIVYSQGSVVLDTVSEVPFLDIEALQSVCNMMSLEASQCYDAYKEMGIDYGMGHQGIVKTYIGSDQVLAKLSLPASVSGTIDQFIMHPSLMDSALQSSVALLMNNSREGKAPCKAYLPFALEELEVFGRCVPKMWAWVRCSDDIGNDTRLQRLNIDICDPQGKVCIRMRGFTSRMLEEDFKAIEERAVISSEAPIGQLTGTIMLKPVWDAVSVKEAEKHISHMGNTIVAGGNEESINTIRQEYPEVCILDIKSKSTIDEIVEKLRNYGLIKHIIWIAPYDLSQMSLEDRLIEGQNNGVIQVFRIIKALLKSGYGEKDLEWSIITRQTQPIHNNERIDSTHASVYGLVGSMAKEYSNWKVRLVDLEKGCKWPVADIFTLLPDVKGNAWVYRGKQWYKQRMIPFHCHKPSDKSLYRKGGVYVVVGGAGGIGEIWSEYMIHNYKARIIWIGRRKIDEAIKEKINRLAAIGDPPEYISADAADGELLQQAYYEIKQRHTHINGIIHSAIVLQDQGLANMNEERFRASLSAKVDTSVRIAQIFKNETLDFIMFFSSMISFIKSPGQSNYAAGCTFKDAFAHQLSHEFTCPVKVINWGYWGDAGIVSSKVYQERMAHEGIGSLEPKEAMDTLEVLLGSPFNQLALAKIIKPSGLQEIELADELITVYPESIHSYINSIDKQTCCLTSAASGSTLQDKVKTALSRLAAELLKVNTEDINTDTELSDYGFDPVMIAEFAKKLNKEYGLEITPAALLDHPTIQSLSNYLAEAYWSTLEKMFGQESVNSAVLELSSFIDNYKSPTEKELLKSIISYKGKQLRELDGILCKLLLGQLQAAGLFNGNSSIDADIKTAGLRDLYVRWLQESLNALVRNNYLRYDGKSYSIIDVLSIDMMDAWKEWDEQKGLWLEGANMKAWVALAELTMKALPQILTGKIPATDIMFPDSSMELVEGIYRNNLIADYFNGILVDSLVDYIKQRIMQEPAARIRIMEIGSGTGGTSRMIFQQLKAYSENIKEYCYTDISKAFLIHGEKEYGQDNSYLKYKIFNAEIPISEQDIDAGGYDIVIAANVLHATKDIRQTIRNVKAAIKSNGLLLLNEMSSNPLITHLTFGLLEGWWLYEDKALRIPGGPGLYPEAWKALLENEGFRSITFTAPEAHELGQQIIAAESDGVVRQKQIINKKADSKQLAGKTVQNKISVQQPIESAGLLKEKSIAYIKKLVAETLKMPVDKIDASEPLEKYGIDSILVVQLTNNMRKVFKDISSTLFFEYQNIDSLAEHFMKNQKDSLVKLVGLEDQQPYELEKADTYEARTATFEQLVHGISPRRSGRFIKLQNEEAKKSASHTAALMDVAVIGLSGRYARVNNIKEFWDNLKSGRSCITEIPKDRWDWKKYYDEKKGKKGSMYTRWGGFIDGIDKFDPLFFQISPREAAKMDPQERLFLEEVYCSIEDAGYTPLNICGSRKVGIFAGVMNGNYATGANYWSIANRVSYIFDFHGPSIAVDTACSSSLTAIHLALESLYSGMSDCAIAGGVNLILDPVHYTRLSEVTMLSMDDRCKAFGDKADGFVDGEGVGAMVLKPLSKAVADGDHIYGVIKGSMLNAGGKTNGYTVPNPNAQYELIADALKRAGIDAGAVSYIEAHGTGTALGDPIEITGLTKAFEKNTSKKQFCSIGSVKSNIGHCESAAGIAGVTKVLLQLMHKKLVPSLHSRELNPNIEFSNTPFIVQQELEEWKRPLIEINGEIREYPRTAGISSFGAGGANAHLIIQEYIPDKEKKNQVDVTAQRPVIIVLSAKNEKLLKEQAMRLLDSIKEQLEDSDLADIAYTLQMGRKAMDERFGIIATTIRQLEEKLKGFAEGQEDIENLYRGQAKNNKGAMDIFAGDEDLLQAVDAWISKGKYVKLLDLWVKGLNFDWSKLYGDIKPNRISLLSCPFARESYWISKNEAKTQQNSDVNENIIPAAKDISIVHEAVKQESKVSLKTLSDSRKLQYIPIIQKKPLNALSTISYIPSKPAEKSDSAFLYEHQIPSDVSIQSLREELKISLAEALDMKYEDVDPDTKFIDMGLDSIIGVEWIRAVNEKYGISIAAIKVYDYPTIRDFTGFLEKELKNQNIKASDNQMDRRAGQSIPKISLQPIASTLRESAATLSEEDFKDIESKKPLTSMEFLQEELTASLAEALDMKHEEVEPDTKFIDMGLDSIIGVEWVRTVNERYGISVPAIKVYDYPTIRDFTVFIKREIDKEQKEDMKVPSLQELILKVQQGSLNIDQADRLLRQFNLMDKH